MIRHGIDSRISQWDTCGYYTLPQYPAEGTCVASRYHSLMYDVLIKEEVCKKYAKKAALIALMLPHNASITHPWRSSACERQHDVSKLE